MTTIRLRKACVPALIVLVVALAGAGFPGPVAAQPPVAEPPFRQAWTVVYPGEASIEAIAGDGERLYVMTAEGLVRAIDPVDGRTVWETSGWTAPGVVRCPYDPPKVRGMNYQPYVPPFATTFLFVDGDYLIASICSGWEFYNTDRQLLVLDRASGDLKYTWPVIGGNVAGVSNGVILLDTVRGAIAVGIAEQRELWRAEPEEDRAPRATAALGDVAILTRMNAEWNYFFSGRDLHDGHLLWELPETELRAPRVGTPEFGFTVRAPIAAQAGDLIALDMRSGEIAWSQPLDPIPDPFEMSVGQRRLYATGPFYSGVGLRAFQPETGELLWTSGAGVGVRLVREIGDFVVFIGELDSRTQLYVCEGETGEVLWSGLPDTRLVVGPDLGGRLFVGSYQRGAAGQDAVLTAMTQR